jgi:hypothetical protein
MAKQRKVCPMISGGRCARPTTGVTNTLKVCIVAAHGKGKIPKARCTLWHMQVPFAGATTTQGNFTGRRSSPNPSPGSKGNNNNNAKQVRPAKPDMIAKLETEAKAEELKARIRTAKDQGRMMLPGITYQQVVEGPVFPLQPPVPVAPRAQQQARPALSPADAIAVLEEVLNRPRNPPPLTPVNLGLKTLLRPPGRPEGRHKELQIMTWNSEGVLCSRRELARSNLLAANNVNIAIITETEIHASSHGDFNVEEYTSYLSHLSNLLKTAKYRVVTIVRLALATSTKILLNLMHAAVQSVGIQLDIQGTPQGT